MGRRRRLQGSTRRAAADCNAPAGPALPCPAGPRSRDEQRVGGSGVLEVQLLRCVGRHGGHRLQQRVQRHEKGERAGRLEAGEGLRTAAGGGRRQDGGTGIWGRMPAGTPQRPAATEQSARTHARTETPSAMADCMTRPLSRKRSLRPLDGSNVRAHACFWLVRMACSTSSSPLTLSMVALVVASIVAGLERRGAGGGRHVGRWAAGGGGANEVCGAWRGGCSLPGAPARASSPWGAGGSLGASGLWQGPERGLRASLEHREQVKAHAVIAMPGAAAEDEVVRRRGRRPRSPRKPRSLGAGVGRAAAGGQGTSGVCASARKRPAILAQSCMCCCRNVPAARPGNRCNRHTRAAQVAARAPRPHRSSMQIA